MLLLALAAASFGVVACDDGSNPTTAQSADTACRLIDRLAESVEPLIAAGVDDPEAFRSAFDAAELDLVGTLDSLADAVPDDLSDDVEEMKGLVEQHRFSDAVEARAPIDEYDRRVCA